MKKKKIQIFVIASVIFVTLFAVIAVPATFYTEAVSTAGFNISLTLTNVAPTITYVAPVSDSPNAGTTKTITFTFNASDLNGVGDIPFDNALVIINNSAVTHTSSSCIVNETSGTTNRFDCYVDVDYDDAAGAWTINASVFDGASAMATDLSEELTLGTTYSISLNRTSLTFSGSAGDNNVAPSNAPQSVLNKGNGAFTNMNITAFDLVGGTSSIAASQFNANITDTPAGTAMDNNTPVAIAGGTLGVSGSRDVFIYLDIPEGVADTTYTSSDEWIVSMS